jgi:hypothetical protein
MRPMNLSRFFLCVFAVTAPVSAGDQLTGFPFQNETLRYNITFASGANLGEATVSASKAEAAGWRFDMSFSAGLPGVPFADTYRSQVTAELCSTELERSITHAARKVTEKTTFDQQHNTAERRTLNPAGGGTSQLQLPPCARDALAYQFFARREMGQGRVAQPSKVFFGGAYDVRMDYTGAMDVKVGAKSEVTDHVNVSIKGPASDVTVEIFYARDAARTPVLIKIPVPIGKITLELVR